MSDDCTIEKITNEVESASTLFEKTNSDLKRRYLIWSIFTFNKIASKVNTSKGSFGTGYPFYALDGNLEGTLPIISEQIRYNRQLVKDGEPFQKSIWKCKSCLQENYDNMPDLKKICKPCPNVPNALKPRKFINRLPDLDMWIVCGDGKVEETQENVISLLDEYKMRTSDVNPILTIDDISNISRSLSKGIMPEIFLPIDTHIIEYSKLKELIEKVPEILSQAKKEKIQPYLPIHPKSYRKQWQYDDEAYNYIYDFLSAFTEYNFPEELQDSLDKSRFKVVSEFSEDELFKFLLSSATEANFRRFQAVELEEYFKKRVKCWKDKGEKSQKVNGKGKSELKTTTSYGDFQL